MERVPKPALRRTRASAPPRLVKVLRIELYRITALWTNGETRLNDYRYQIFNEWKDHIYMGQLADYEKFKTVRVEHGAFQWPAILVDMSKWEGVEPWQPMDFDPDVAYSESTLIESLDAKKKLASMLRTAREGAGLTQGALAAKVGFTKAYISKIERGVTDVQFGTLEWILRAGFDKGLTAVDL